MTDYGETPTGWRGKTFAEAAAELRARMRARISEALTLDEKDWLGNAVDIWGDIESQIWDAMEVVRNAFDPDNAEGPAAIALAALTGTKQRLPTKGTVPCTVNLDASKTFAPGDLVAHVEGQPDNRWVNKDTITSTTAGNYTNRTFIAETAGPFIALNGKLKIIAQTKSGWNSIVNTADATPGLALEEIPDLMVRREQELGALGAGTVAAIHKAVAAVTGVIEVRVFLNDTQAPIVISGVTIPQNCVRVVVWDGSPSGADNDAIAQAIQDKKSGGCTPIGGGGAPGSGLAIDFYGETKTVNFSRVTWVSFGCSITVEAPTGTNTTQLTDDIKASIVALWPTKIGAPIYVSKLIAGPASQDAVISVVAMGIGSGGPPPYAAQSAVPSLDQIYRISTGSIYVTVNLV